MQADQEAITLLWDRYFNPASLKKYKPFSNFWWVVFLLGGCKFFSMTSEIKNPGYKFQQIKFIVVSTVYFLSDTVTYLIWKKAGARQFFSPIVTPLTVWLISIQYLWFGIFGFLFYSATPRIMIYDQGFLPWQYPLSLITLLEIVYILLILTLIINMAYRKSDDDQKQDPDLRAWAYSNFWASNKYLLTLIPPAVTFSFIGHQAGIRGKALFALVILEPLFVVLGAIGITIQLFNRMQLVFQGLERSPYYGKTINQAIKVYEARGKERPSQIYAWCPVCDKPGYAPTLGSVDDPAFLICTECKTDQSSLWCEDCGVGGDFIRGIETRPDHWRCPTCDTRTPLPADFYKKPFSISIDQDYK